MPQPQAASDPLALIHEQHEMAKAQYGQLTNVRTMMDHVRVELETLQKLGDMVTPEDVIKGAGMLVAHGASPVDMAGMLADMPQGGLNLSTWISQHAAAVTAKEQQLAPALEQARHELAVSGFRVLAGHSLMPGGVAQHGAGAGAPGQPPPTPVLAPGISPNPLTGAPDAS